MLLFGEVHTNEIPLGHIEYSDFVELIVNQDIRPERPDGDEAPQLTDDSWQLAELCWKKDPVSRPNVGTVCDTMSRLLDNNPRQRVMKVNALPCMSTLFSCSIFFASLNPQLHHLSSSDTPSLIFVYPLPLPNHIQLLICFERNAGSGGILITCLLLHFHLTAIGSSLVHGTKPFLSGIGEQKRSF